MVWPFSSSASSASGSSSSSSGAPSTSADATAPTPAPAVNVNANASADSTDAAAYLRSHSFTTPSASAEYTPTASSLLSDPSLDVSTLHPMAGLGKDELEYLDIVDAQPSQLEGARTALPSRGWSDDLCYGTGTTYLSGLALGGLLGAREGLARPLGVDQTTFRLRLNAVLNQVTRRGSFFGNSAGVIALIYNLVDAAIDGVRGKHDIYGAMSAGALSGALFKSTAGLRPMAISSAIMVAAAATWTTAKQALL